MFTNDPHPARPVLRRPADQRKRHLQLVPGEPGRSNAHVVGCRSVSGAVRQGHLVAAPSAADSGALDLALSENPFPPLRSVLDAINRVLSQANRYPDFLPQQLPKVIADRIGVDADQVVVGCGATGVAMQIMQALTVAGDNMVFGSPTYDGYPLMAGMIGLDTVPVPLDSAGRQDLRAIADAVNERTALLAVCRPHNPTGTVIGTDELEAFLCSVPRRVPIILDEAYGEFLDAADTIDTVSLIQRHPNVIVLRTFSKAYGLAGLRIGYAFGDTELIGRVRRLQLPFGMSTAAVAAVTASYAAEAELAERIRQITTERELLRTSLRQHGIQVPDSRANFLYVPGCDIADRLAQAGIIAKTYPDGSARIAVGDPAASRAVLHALTRDRVAAAKETVRTVATVAQ
jgi:histidinol-phosphate aminotransferase